MQLKDRLQTDLKEAMRAKDKLRMETIRNIRAAILNKEVELERDVDEDTALALIKSLCKQRDDAIVEYEKGGRSDLADAERAEKVILEGYLPAAPDAAAVEAAVEAAIAEVGATSMKDMGRVMKQALARLGPTADGKQVSALVKQKLA